MHRPSLRTFLAQRATYDNLQRLCFGDASIRRFDVSEYDGCRFTMNEMADQYMREKTSHTRYIEWDLAYLEKMSDDWDTHITVVTFMGEDGEAFSNCWKRRILYNFETKQPDIELTLQLIAPMLDHPTISPEVIEWINEITDPALQGLKRKLVLKRLVGTVSKGWLYVPVVEETD